jgi:formylglycine-generating enzyme required for sulfatase activity
VGSKKDGVGRFLQADLSGNVSEWVLDWYIDTPPSPCKDCANFDPGAGKFRNFMGGSFEKNAFNQQNGGTASTQPTNTMYTTGARCARN